MEVWRSNLFSFGYRYLDTYRKEAGGILTRFISSGVSGPLIFYVIVTSSNRSNSSSNYKQLQVNTGAPQIVASKAGKLGRGWEAKREN